MTFRRLWIGQLFSNLGTQVCLYALSLWIFRLEGRLQAIAAVLVVVQLAKVATMPVISRWLPGWPRRRVMVVCNLLSCSSSLCLAGSLALRGGELPLWAVLPWLVVAASMEAVLGLCLSTMVPLMLPQHRWAAVNGWVAGAEGVVNMASPFLGALVVIHLGLAGIAGLDALSTGVALICLGGGRWCEAWQAPPDAPDQKPLVGTRNNLRHFIRWPLTRSLLLMGVTMMATCAAVEVLFPAWILAAFPTDALPRALLISAITYGAGMIVWRRYGTGHWRFWLVVGLLIQAFVLMAAAWSGFEQLIPAWLFGVGAFNFAVPIVVAALQTLWMNAVPIQQQLGAFAARHALEWAARLFGAAAAAALVDYLMHPLLNTTVLGQWFGQGVGRAMALTLALVGLVQLAVVAFQTPALIRSSKWAANGSHS